MNDYVSHGRNVLLRSRLLTFLDQMNGSTICTPLSSNQAFFASDSPIRTTLPPFRSSFFPRSVRIRHTFARPPPGRERAIVLDRDLIAAAEPRRQPCSFGTKFARCTVGKKVGASRSAAVHSHEKARSPMKSHAYPATVMGMLNRRQSEIMSRRAAFDEDWAMLRLIGWTATTAVLAFLIWQVAAPHPLWPPAVSAFVLVVVSVLAGLRLGADSASTYTKDLQRLNNVIAEQNRELAEANATLLKEPRSESRSASKSA